MADLQLVGMPASQIDICVKSIDQLESQGLVINFNNEVTMGPNLYMTIADKAPNRSIQIMRELELSPKARAGRATFIEFWSEMKRFLEDP